MAMSGAMFTRCGELLFMTIIDASHKYHVSHILLQVRRLQAPGGLAAMVPRRTELKLAQTLQRAEASMFATMESVMQKKNRMFWLFAHQHTPSGEMYFVQPPSSLAAPPVATMK